MKFVLLHVEGDTATLVRRTRMEINCPDCHGTGTTRPDELLGRIYVCARCRQMLHLAPHRPRSPRWRPIATLRTGRPRSQEAGRASIHQPE
ncbi:MAG: hypothetical protein QNI85_11725 [Desulfobacterales bacterium]|nr:hypothetical protein [Desulfobacterales bacterium]MDJ0990673.1 hypothetical protein [Desulfobacterales bacterium]